MVQGVARFLNFLKRGPLPGCIILCRKWPMLRMLIATPRCGLAPRHGLACQAHVHDSSAVSELVLTWRANEITRMIRIWTNTLSLDTIISGISGIATRLMVTIQVMVLRGWALATLNGLRLSVDYNLLCRIRKIMMAQIPKAMMKMLMHHRHLKKVDHVDEFLGHTFTVHVDSED